MGNIINELIKAWLAVSMGQMSFNNRGMNRNQTASFCPNENRTFRKSISLLAKKVITILKQQQKKIVYENIRFFMEPEQMYYFFYSRCITT